MSRNYAEMEREFLENLKADTGRDLAEWMATIDGQSFAHRNDAIDWLRQQGFLFAWASWLERIHNNGGDPIYCSIGSKPAVTVRETAPRQQAAPSTQPAQPAPATATRSEVAESSSSSAIVLERPLPPLTPARPALRLVHSREVEKETAAHAPPQDLSSAPPAVSMPSAVAKPRSSAPTSPQVAAIIASAKAYAPLAGFVVRRILETAPDCEIKASGKHITFQAGALPFALLAVGSKDLRLAFAGPDGVWTAPVEKVRLPKTAGNVSPSLTHMLVLTDARQIDAAFDSLLSEAYRRTPALERQ